MLLNSHALQLLRGTGRLLTDTVDDVVANCPFVRPSSLMALPSSAFAMLQSY